MLVNMDYGVEEQMAIVILNGAKLEPCGTHLLHIAGKIYALLDIVQLASF